MKIMYMQKESKIILFFLFIAAVLSPSYAENKLIKPTIISSGEICFKSGTGMYIYNPNKVTVWVSVGVKLGSGSIKFRKGTLKSKKKYPVGCSKNRFNTMYKYTVEEYREAPASEKELAISLLIK